MAQKNSGYIDVDSLQQELVASGNAVERIAGFYSVDLPELHKSQNETRMACIFACGKEQETGDRAISIKTKQDGAVFRCFQYGCTIRGNLLNLMYLMKHDMQPADGKLKGAEFKEIASDLQALVEGRTVESEQKTKKEASSITANEEPLVNVPLKDSDNERARALVDLDKQFIIDVAEMSPKAAAYVRQRPFMTPEFMQKFRCGYLPQNAKGLLRGHFVYGYPDAEGNILTWFGRNLNFEEQYKKWVRSGDSSKEPQKFKFVKGFHRGQELYGLPQFQELAIEEQLQKTGIIIVEGPNDAINLHTLGIPALAICSNMITETQVDKLSCLVNQTKATYVSVMFDLDAEGEKGANQAVLELAKRCPTKLAWNSVVFGKKHNGKQPELVSSEEMEMLI